MNILCVICSDLLTKPDDIFYTRCGHVFHFECLTQWLERSKSCPQCREKVTQSRIHKLYLTMSNNDTNLENDPQAQDKLASLKFQIMLKEKDINYFMSKNATLEKQNAGLRKEVRKLESDINEKNSVIYALKEQTKYFKDQISGYENAKKEVTQLKKKIEDLRNVQMLLDAPIEDVQDIVGRDKSPGTLLTYVYVMKKEIESNLNKIKHLKIKVKNLQDEHAKITMRSDAFPQNYSSNRQLEEEFAFCESEKMALQSRVIELEEMLGITESPQKTDIDIAQEVKSKHETTKECLGNSVSQKSSSRKRSHTNSKHSKNSMENTSSLSIDTTENDSMLESTNSDCSIASKKTKTSKIHDKIYETNDLDEEDNTENIVQRSKYANTSTNICLQVPKVKEEKVRKEKLNKTKHHKRNIIDLT
ncbi:hypothetical protein KPH14_008419 [Odynerus spinipes]|uniref:RING-type domain-containing protein n=1 Tax=Odynerus spinipes TaxID=1348599 RepID=A0AAD9RE50_9HYME|nr:hypothetical protein KPH14_008419 [Odynerus spinipes]